MVMVVWRVLHLKHDFNKREECPVVVFQFVKVLAGQELDFVNSRPQLRPLVLINAKGAQFLGLKIRVCHPSLYSAVIISFAHCKWQRQGANVIGSFVALIINKWRQIENGACHILGRPAHCSVEYMAGDRIHRHGDVVTLAIDGDCAPGLRCGDHRGSFSAPIGLSWIALRTLSCGIQARSGQEIEFGPQNKTSVALWVSQFNGEVNNVVIVRMFH